MGILIIYKAYIREIFTLTGMTSSLNLLHDNIKQRQLKTFDVYLLQKSSDLGQMLK